MFPGQSWQTCLWALASSDPDVPCPPHHISLGRPDDSRLSLWNKSDEFDPLDSPENTSCCSLVSCLLAQPKDSGRMRVGRVPSVSATGQGRPWPSLHPPRLSPLLTLLVPGKSLFSPVPGKAASPWLWGLKTSASESFITSALDFPSDSSVCIPSRMLQLGFALSLVSTWDQGGRGVFLPATASENCVPLFSTYAAPS